MREFYISEIKNKFLKQNITYIEDLEIESLVDEWKGNLDEIFKGLFEEKNRRENISLTDFKTCLKLAFDSCEKYNTPFFKIENVGFLSVFGFQINESFIEIESFLNNLSHSIKIDSSSIIDSYKEYLLESLSKLSKKTIYHEFKVWEEKYNNDFEEFKKRLNNRLYLNYLNNKYPFLYRLVNKEIKGITKYFKQILNNLSCDWDKVNSEIIQIDCLKSVSLGLGDKHKGKSVCILEFKNGNKILYKPHSLNNGYNYSNFINQFFNKKIKYKIEFPKIVLGENYGWEEFIEHSKTNDKSLLKEYYYKIGFHLCALYFLNGNDIHYDNNISTINNPFFIDLETLISPYIDGINFDANVLRVGLLPMLHFNGEDYIQFGGISNTKNQKSPFKLEKIDLEKGLIYEDVKIGERKNIPYENDQKLIDFKNDIIDGFDRCYSVLIENKQHLSKVLDENFKNSEIRFLVRDTMIYSHILNESFHPYHMTTGVLFEQHIDSIWFQFTEDIPKGLIKSEKESLLNLDIPYFHTYYDSTSLFSSNGYEFKEYFKNTSKESLQFNINNLSVEDKNKQIWLIKASLITDLLNNNQ